MTKSLFFLVVLCLPPVCCDMGSEPQPFDYDRDTPPWLKTKIESMTGDPYYAGTVVYRYTWHSAFVYDIVTPLSSCAYCEVYDHQGNHIDLTEDSTLHDFLQNRHNQVVVWGWKELD